MKKIGNTYCLNTSGGTLTFNKDNAIFQQGEVINTISHLEGAKRAIFDYRESEEWVVCRPFEKLNPNAEEQMLMEIRDIVGVETMIDAINWSEIVKEDYQIAQSNFLSKTLGKK